MLASAHDVFLGWDSAVDEAGHVLSTSIEVLLDSKPWKKQIIFAHQQKFVVRGLRLHSAVEFKLRPVSVYKHEGQVTFAKIATNTGKKL